MRTLPLVKKTFVVSSLLVMSGCADFQLPQLPALPTLKEPDVVWTNSTPEQMCDAYKENGMRAHDMYLGKSISVIAENRAVGKVAYGGTPRTLAEKQYVESRGDTLLSYEASFTYKEGNKITNYGRVNIKGHTTGILESDRRVALSLTSGKKYKISGVIVDFDYDGECSIRLRDAKFSEL